MTDERIEELWKKACDIVTPSGPVRYLFARLVAAETARECAEMADREHDVWLTPTLKTVAKHIADAIRHKFGVEDA